MQSSVVALIGYAAWSLALLGILEGMRAALVLSGERRANEFPPDGSGTSAFGVRLIRAHANCYENLPVFVAIVVAATMLGRSTVLDSLALWFLGARVAQSVVHLVSTSPAAVSVRFALFLAQYAILAYWVVRLVSS